MKAGISRLFKGFGSQEIGREVEEELRFHLDLLTQDLLQQELSLEEARDAALKRFGSVEQIRDQCVEISRRRHPFMLALKTFLIAGFLSGVLLRVLGTDVHVRHCGDLLMAISVLSRLFLYVRGLNPSSFLSKHEDSSPLMLNTKTRKSITNYDQRGLTPVERVIFDK